MTKFYYNNELIRTSKTKNYKYAVIAYNNGEMKVFRCSETKANAEKAHTAAINELKEDIEREKRNCKYSGINLEENAEYFNKLERYIKTMQIVELESR